MKKKLRTLRSRTTKRSHKEKLRKRKKACRSIQQNRPGRRRKQEFILPTRPSKVMPDVKFNTYIRKVLKKVKPRAKIDMASIRVMDTLVKDTLHQIATKASEKMGRRKVLKPKIIVRALKKVIPKSLLHKVDEHAQRALDRYMKKSRRR